MTESAMHAADTRGKKETAIELSRIAFAASVAALSLAFTPASFAQEKRDFGLGTMKKNE